MKIAGEEIDATYKKKITFHRPGKEIVLRLQAVNNSDELGLEMPTPPWITKVKDGVPVRAFDDEDYLKEVEAYSKHKYNWMCLKTLEPSEIIWDTVDLTDPETFINWLKDLSNAGFSEAEIIRIQREISTVNGLSADAITSAEADF